MTDRIGDYELLAKIGEGGMGVVHLAQDPSGQRVAVKVLRPHVVGDQQSRARLAREVSSLRRVRSPRVAEVYDADPWGELPYLVTRYVHGLSLYDQVRQHGPIGGDHLHLFAHGLAEALVAVHQADVLHRDVKPSNVLVESGNPVLIDFGLAQLSDDSRLTHTGWLLGTPGYLAPEILYGEDPTPAADVHSWAATVVFAATGRGPFGTGPAVAVMDRVRRAEYDLSGLPDSLYWMVTRSLMPDPRDRPRAAQLADWSSGLVAGAASVPDIAASDAQTQVVTRASRRPALAPPPIRQPPPAQSQPRLRPTAPPAPPTSVSPAEDGSYLNPSDPPVRRANWLVAAVFWVGLLAVITAAAVTAPVVAAVGLLVAEWMLRTVYARARTLHSWRLQRGVRRLDGALATICTPWFGLVRLPGAVANVAVAVLLGALVVVLASILLPTSSVLPALGLGGLVAGLIAWGGPLSRDVRRGGRQVTGSLLRPGMPTLLSLLVVAVVFAGLLVLRETSGPTYAPLPSPPWAQSLRSVLP